MRKICALVAAGGVFGSCAGDGLAPDNPDLVLTVYLDSPDFPVDRHDNHADPVWVDMGRVPVYGTKRARFWLENPETKALAIYAVEYLDNSEHYASGDLSGETWTEARIFDGPESANDLLAKLRAGEAESVKVPPHNKFIMEIPYAAAVEDAAELVGIIHSNAKSGSKRLFKVMVSAFFDGAPDLEVQYKGIKGPKSSECVDIDTDGVIDGCAMGQPLEIGNIGFGGQGTAQLIIKNAADCPPFPGGEPCSQCALTIAEGIRGLGLGFKAGTNADGLFSVVGATAPFTIRQGDPGCEESGQARLLVSFDAPQSAGVHEALIVVESNSPGEPVVEVPLWAHARNAPVAIAGFREVDISNPGGAYTIADEIEPLDRVYFDGRAKGTTQSTHDPQNPADTSLITSYFWDPIEYPPGASPADFRPSGQNTGLYDMWLPLAGHYVVRLEVTNAEGIASGDTPASRVEFDAIPRDRMHIQLVWDDAKNDQDLHLTLASVDDRVCNLNYDCFFDNCADGSIHPPPQWRSSDAPREGANPSLDIDDKNGTGPENINIAEPQVGTYGIYVHYFGGSDAGFLPTRQTVRIWLNSVQVAQYKRTLTEAKAIWAVGHITWQADDTGYVTQHPADADNQIGAVANMPQCLHPGYTIP